MRRTRRKEKKGFTLVELICVVALLAILAVLAVPAYNKVQDGARQQIANSNARTVYSIGKANEALEAAGIPSENWEEQLDGGTYESGSAAWSGTISGKSASGVYVPK